MKYIVTAWSLLTESYVIFPLNLELSYDYAKALQMYETLSQNPRFSNVRICKVMDIENVSS